MSDLGKRLVGTPSVLLNDAADRIAALEAQRDELLEALIEIREDCIARSDRNGVVPIGRSAWDGLQNAIKKAKETK